MRWRLTLLLIAVISAITAAQPGFGVWSVPSNPTGVGTFSTTSLAQVTGLTCSWSSSTQATLAWTAGSSAATGYEVQRGTNGAARSDDAAVSGRATVSYTEAPSSPASNTYAYSLLETVGSNWRSNTDSSVVTSDACSNAITQVASSTTTAQVSLPEQVVVDSVGNVIVADTGNNCIRMVAQVTGTYYNIAMKVGIIYSIAGQCGLSGGTGDTGAATSAKINTPEGMALDSSNNLYIADTLNAAIRKVNRSTGIITTVAGTNGTAGYGGDTFSAIAVGTKLDHPKGVAVDSAGRIYISDTTNCRIRMVDAGGTITTPTALGTGTCGSGNTQVNASRALAVDSSGNLYWADRSNNQIRKVTCTGSCTSGNAPTLSATNAVVANTGGLSGSTGDGGAATSAKLSNPTGIAIDSNDNIFVADSGNNEVRVICAATSCSYGSNGNIYLVAGSGSTSYTGDGYPATGTNASNLNNDSGVAVFGGIVYIADTTRNLIRQVTSHGNLLDIVGDTNGPYVSDLVEGTSARLAIPAGLAVDSSNNVIIADASDHRIRKFFSGRTGGTYEVATIVGTGSAGSNADGTDGVAATVKTPEAVAVDSSGNVIWVDDTSLHVRVLANVTATQWGVAMTSGKVYTIAGTGISGSTGDTGAGTSAKISAAFGVTVDSSGRIIIADTGNCRIREISTGGIINNIFGTGTCSASASTVNAPKGVFAVGSTVYVADTANNRILQLACTAPCSATPPAYTMTVVAGSSVGSSGSSDNATATSGTLSGPTNVWVTGTTIYIADNVNNKLRKAVVGGALSSVTSGTANSSTGDNGPYSGTVTTGGIYGVVGTSTELFLSEQSTFNVVRKIAGIP